MLHSFGDEPQSKADTAPREDREEILIEAAVIEVTLNGTNSAETIYFGSSDSERQALTADGQYPKAFAPFGGTNLDFDSIIAQLAAQKEVKILQRPRIQTWDGMPANLFVGDSRSRQRSWSSWGEPDKPAAENRHSMNELLGITLDISPTITPERKLHMNITQTIEKCAGNVNITNVGTVPITSRKEMQTEVTVGDRQTVVLGGPVEQTQDKSSKGIPVLKNTPLIGGLFRNHPRQMKVETIVAIRATILPQDHASR